MKTDALNFEGMGHPSRHTTLTVQSVAMNISSKREFPLTLVHFSLCKKLNYSASVLVISNKSILVEREITVAIYTINS